jgi:hypothetical protein
MERMIDLKLVAAGHRRAARLADDPALAESCRLLAECVEAQAARLVGRIASDAAGESLIDRMRQAV